MLLPDVLPGNRGWPEAEPRIRRLNALIAELARGEGVKMLQFHDTLEDPELPGRMRAEWTPDGNHPSVEGHRVLGEQAFSLPDLQSSGETRLIVVLLLAFLLYKDRAHSIPVRPARCIHHEPHYRRRRTDPPALLSATAKDEGVAAAHEQAEKGAPR